MNEAKQVLESILEDLFYQRSVLVDSLRIYPDKYHQGMAEGIKSAIDTIENELDELNRSEL